MSLQLTTITGATLEFTDENSTKQFRRSLYHSFVTMSKNEVTRVRELNKKLEEKRLAFNLDHVLSMTIDTEDWKSEKSVSEAEV